jgi:hypothetical protein
MAQEEKKEMNRLGHAVVELASAQVGTKEEGGPNKGPPVEKYAGGREEPWCAHFVAWLYRRCGEPIPGDIEPSRAQYNPIAAVKQLWAQCRRAGWNRETPSVGAIVVFNSRMGSDAEKGRWHCGIVSAIENGMIQTIEGNSGDKVQRRLYTLKHQSIVGFAAPPELT